MFKVESEPQPDIHGAAINSRSRRSGKPISLQLIFEIAIDF